MTHPTLDAEEHLAFAERLWALAQNERTSTGDRRAWAVVTEFYAAVHWVRAFIRTIEPNAHFSTHGHVTRIMKKSVAYSPILLEYDALKQASHAVRYYAETEFEDVEVTTRWALNIKAFVATKLRGG